ncbi:pimeloyl-ACP methyl ester carboxylesterase [Nocardioides albertanoniae]|uniref:Pimeloyl-ACP methyl ester carboxylesterase n=1 Tax=Nocardioides albertanoniae TaxID=1175486 RepID=A0A543A7Z4_9ACTN|nr:alpha/beta fold hydrolase [Nocardioides albertanoniae]TQL68596.1 pimeloyl-ACP methyl ester carboxylesterase [Nocardioides albertanoniae]
MDIVLVPGLWLDASSWDLVVPHLTDAGHSVRALTLPGLESAEADRSAVHVADQVAAVVAAIDEASGPVTLVGHSMGCAVAGAAVDARVDAVANVIYVGGWPAEPGMIPAKNFPTDGADLPPVPWEEFDEADVRDLDRVTFEALLRPSPASLTSEPFELDDERRYDVPTLLVCPEYTAADLQGWVADDAEPVAAIPRHTNLSYVDLPTGHWPQLTKPAELAAIIDRSTGR